MKIKNNKLPNLDGVFAYSEMTRKIVTSTNALIAEEPLDELVLYELAASRVPNLSLKESYQGEDYYPGVDSVDQYCFGFVYQYPEGVDPNFGRITISSLPREWFKLKESVFKAAKNSGGMNGLSVCGINNNFGDSVMLGSAIYSWVKQSFELKGEKPPILGSSNNLAFKRTTRTQLPAGVYGLVYFNAVFDSVTGKRLRIHQGSVALVMESEKGHFSKKKKGRSSAPTDVVLEMGM